MSGYTVAFGSMFQGSLCGQWPALPVFCTLLPLADKNGELDYSFGYLARVTGWPEELLREGIAQLEQADPHSRTPSDDGRRLTRLRDNTEWGWKLVNHAKYREKARKAAYDAVRTASGADAERKRLERQSEDVPTCPDASRALPLSNTNTNTDKEGAKAPTPKSSRKPTQTTLPDSFAFTPDLAAYVAKHLPDADAQGLFDKFTGQAKAKAWKYADWSQAFQTYVRSAGPNSGHWSSGQYPKATGAIKW